MTTFTPAAPAHAELRAQAKSMLDRANLIAEATKADGREFTPAERTQVKALIEEARSLNSRADALAADSEARKAITANIGGTRSLTLGAWGKAAQDHLIRLGMGKDLTPSGSINLPPVSATIVTEFDRPTSILQLIPHEPTDTDELAYRRETLRDHRASSVKPGHLKPTSLYELELIRDRCRTIATLTEPIPNQTLSDTDGILAYLDGALRAAVTLELERQVLEGDGDDTGVLDDLIGVRNVDGLQVQAFATDRFTSTRKAVTKLEVANVPLTGAAWAMTPAAWEAFELSTDTDHFVMGDAAGQARVPVDRAGRKLWGLSVVTTTALEDDDLAILGDWAGSIRTREREGVQVAWTEAAQVALPGDSSGATASLFETNQRLFRAETRVGLEITRPAGFVEVALS